MGDLRGHVERAASVARDRLFGQGQEGMAVMPGDRQAPHLLELDDLDLVIERHRRIAHDNGFRGGLESGMKRGRASERMLIHAGIEAAGRELATKLANTLEELKDVMSEKPTSENGRDRRSREEIRQGAEQVLAGAREVTDVLWQLADAAVAEG